MSKRNAADTPGLRASLDSIPEGSRAKACDRLERTANEHLAKDKAYGPEDTSALKTVNQSLASLAHGAKKGWW